MTKEQTSILYSVLSDMQDYLYNDLDAICDEDYKAIAEDLLGRVTDAMNMVRQN